MPGGVRPQLGDVFKNPALGESLRQVAAKGRDGYYTGKLAENMVKFLQANGGAHALEDFAEFQPEWVEPITTNYHGYDIFQLPPPGQGMAALEMLNILEVCVPKLGMNLTALGPADPMYWHLLVEAKKLAYSDLLAKNADPKFAQVPVKTLLSKDYAATLCGKINPNVAAKPGFGTSTEGGTI